MARTHKLHARTTILIIRPSQTPTRTSCHVKATEPCAYFYVWDFSLVGIMQWFSTQSKLNSVHMTWEHISKHFHLIFRFINGTWNVFATKKNLCPSTRWSKRAKHSWWQMSLWPHIEDHVWFEDRWMVASLCDELLTTLCGLILG
jgi:hypothetical protein